MVWTLLGLMTTMVHHFQEDSELIETLFIKMGGHYLLGLLGVPVWMLMNRARGTSLPHTLAWHTLGAVTYTLAWGLLYLAIYPLLTSWQRFISEPFEFYYLHLLDDAFKTYLLIAVASTAVIYYRKKEAAARLAAEAESHRRGLELSVLKTQLNPHFLFNCLNTVNALVGRNPEEARRVLAALGETLRYSLDSDQTARVPLDEELRFTQTYLEIEACRFGERLQTVWRIESGLSNLAVPPMMLQPLVENAVKHALSKRVESLEVVLEIKRDDEGVLVSVSDDGPGSKETMTQLLGRGRGLHHTHRRLKALYPDNAGLSVSGETGFRVSFRLPFETLDDEERGHGLQVAREPVHV